MTKCEICGKEFKIVSHKHLRNHNISTKKYKQLYPDAILTWNSGVSDERTKANGRKTLLTKGRKKNKLCPVCGNYVKRFKKFCNSKCYGKAMKLGLIKSGFPKGYIPYNKGLTIQNSSALKEIYRKRIIGRRAGAGIAGFRRDLGHFVRSRWEANIARLFEYYNISYDYEPLKIFIGDGYYTPDFYLRSYNCYIEIIGYLTKVKEYKLKQVMELYPSLKLYILDGDGYKMLETKFSSLIPNWEFSNSKQEVM